MILPHAPVPRVKQESNVSLLQRLHELCKFGFHLFEEAVVNVVNFGSVTPHRFGESYGVVSGVVEAAEVIVRRYAANESPHFLVRSWGGLGPMPCV